MLWRMGYKNIHCGNIVSENEPQQNNDMPVDGMSIIIMEEVGKSQTLPITNVLWVGWLRRAVAGRGCKRFWALGGEHGRDGVSGTGHWGAEESGWLSDPVRTRNHPKVRDVCSCCRASALCMVGPIAQTPWLRFVVDLLCNKCRTNRSNGVCPYSCYRLSYTLLHATWSNSWPSWLYNISGYCVHTSLKHTVTFETASLPGSAFFHHSSVILTASRCRSILYTRSSRSIFGWPRLLPFLLIKRHQVNPNH